MVRMAIMLAAMAWMSTVSHSAETTWTKFCEDAHQNEFDPTAKLTTRACSTYGERLDHKTGEIQMVAALREVEGADNKILWVKMPRGVTLSEGLRLGIYTPELWAKALKEQQVDFSELYVLNLKFISCDAKLCMARVSVGDETVEKLRQGAAISAIGKADGKVLGFAMKLNGFEEAFTGRSMSKGHHLKVRAQLREKERESLRAK